MEPTLSVMLNSEAYVSSRSRSRRVLEDVQHLFLPGRIQIQVFGATQFLFQIGQLSLPTKGIVHEVDQDVSSGPGLVEHSQLIVRIAQLGAAIHDFQKIGASRCELSLLQVEYARQIQGRFRAGDVGQGPRSTHSRAFADDPAAK